MLAADLAALYGVDTRERVQAVKRNAGRFPSDFMFQLTTEEFARLRSQMGSQSRVAVVAARRPMPSPSKA